MSSQKHILCVDDDKDSCELITFMLKASSDLDVSSVHTATDAVSLIASQTFDLYILDYRLPGLTGIELCRLIRKSDSDTPIVFFTAMAYEKDRKSAMEAGANVYLVKPNDIEIFTDTIEKLLKAQEK